MHLPSEREAESLTGLQAGGISPLALINKGFQVVIDTAAQTCDEFTSLAVSAVLNIQLRVNDLVMLVNAQFGNISRIG